MGSSYRVGHTGLSGFVECFHVLALVSGLSGVGKERGGKGRNCIRMVYNSLYNGS